MTRCILLPPSHWITIKVAQENYFLWYGEVYFGHQLLSMLESMTFKQIYASLGLDLENDNLDLKITSQAGVEIATSTVTNYCGFSTKLYCCIRVVLVAKSQQVHCLNGRPDFFPQTH